MKVPASLAPTTGQMPGGAAAAGRISAGASDLGQNSKAREPGVVVTLSGRDGASQASAATYSARQGVAQPMKTMTFNYYSFGDESPFASPQGPTRLEYNAYRPDGLEIDGSQNPFVVKATGEALTPEVAAKYKAMLQDVSRHRIDLFKDGQAAGQSNEAIRARLQAFDGGLPAFYKALVGPSDFVSANRYMNPTHDEVMGGAPQTV